MYSEAIGDIGTVESASGLSVESDLVSHDHLLSSTCGRKYDNGLSLSKRTIEYVDDTKVKEIVSLNDYTDIFLHEELETYKDKFILTDEQLDEYDEYKPAVSSILNVGGNVFNSTETNVKRQDVVNSRRANIARTETYSEHVGSIEIVGGNNDVEDVSAMNFSCTDEKTQDKNQSVTSPENFVQSSSFTEVLHNNSKTYICQICYSVFLSSSELIAHVKVHNDERPYECEICHKRYKTRSAVKRHSSVHSDIKPFMCEICNKFFATISKLKEHVAGVHTRSKTTECDVCGAFFHGEGHLKRHKRRHAGLKEYPCSFCGKNYTTMGVLKKHIKIHINAKLYKCNFCVKSFNDKNNLKLHQVTHSIKKPFNCHCGKGYLREEAFEEHQKKCYDYFKVQ